MERLERARVDRNSRLMIRYLFDRRPKLTSSARTGTISRGGSNGLRMVSRPSITLPLWRSAEMPQPGEHEAARRSFGSMVNQARSPGTRPGQRGRPQVARALLAVPPVVSAQRRTPATARAALLVESGRTWKGDWI